MKNNTIEVLGTGCATCRKLYEITTKVVAEMGLDIKVEYVTDVQRIIQMGLMQSPVLAVNNKAVMLGYTADVEKIKHVIQSNL